ncbi:MAG TPA: MgtC/SapB family protein, partial [Ignisphaera sp.]|nr:MgtC/SapB family protein [Ignisphaera sp.]
MDGEALFLPSVDQWYLLVKILISFLAGALIGLEREKAKTSTLKEEGEAAEFPPGVRSFGFISILGLFSITIPQILGQTIGFIEFVRIMPVAITVLAVSIIVLYSAYRLLILKEAGITTPLALSIAFAIGVLIGLDRLIEAVATSVFVTFMLATKLRIEALIRFITYEELLSMLEIGIIVFLLGPF